MADTENCFVQNLRVYQADLVTPVNTSFMTVDRVIAGQTFDFTLNVHTDVSKAGRFYLVAEIPGKEWFEGAALLEFHICTMNLRHDGEFSYNQTVNFNASLL